MAAESLELSTADGPMPAYQANPDGEPAGAVLVVQEAFGITPHIESICRRLAEAGYLAVAPAFFHRQGSPVFDYGDMQSIGPVMMALTAEGIRADCRPPSTTWPAWGGRAPRWVWSASAWGAA